jgi:uncharacterized oligopeptide transporter (OPT) family protein
MILLFGFLFVTVSSRLTGEVGSSSNPISGMTIATLLLTCMVFVLVGKTAAKDVTVLLTSLSIAAVVCVASSNGGTTSQDLKTGYLVGATPKLQQYAILVGAITSAAVIGVTMLLLNDGKTHYTNKPEYVPQGVKLTHVPSDAPTQRAGKPHQDDTNTYRRVYIRKGEEPAGVSAGWYLVDDDGYLRYRIDVPIDRKVETMDDDNKAPEEFKAPQPALFALLIKGILGGELEWPLILGGALIAIALELMGISSLPVAVGMYLGLGTATPVFVGGMVRWMSDRLRGVSASEAETETSPGVLLSSGYIAGGTLCGLLIGFLVMPLGEEALRLVSKEYASGEIAKLLSVVLFAVLGAFLLYIGTKKSPELSEEREEPSG